MLIRVICGEFVLCFGLFKYVRFSVSLPPSNYYQETDMGRKEEYKLQNEQFMQTLRTEADVHELPCGILYKVLEEGSAQPRPVPTVWCRFITRALLSMDVNLIIPGSGTVPKLFV